jgi:hypothetical protein
MVKGMLHRDFVLLIFNTNSYRLYKLDDKIKLQEFAFPIPEEGSYLKTGTVEKILENAFIVRNSETYSCSYLTL